MPLKRPSRCDRRTAQGVGYLPLPPGFSTVRYPIPQRTFKYVATVQSVTDETCQSRTNALPSDHVARNSCRRVGLDVAQLFERRQVARAAPNAFLNARENAASES